MLWSPGALIFLSWSPGGPHTCILDQSPGALKPFGTRMSVLRRLQETSESASSWIWRSRDGTNWCFSAFCCPASPWWLLSGATGATHAWKTSTGIGPKRRHGFQVRMEDAEQCGLPCCMCFLFFFTKLNQYSTNNVWNIKYSLDYTGTCCWTGYRFLPLRLNRVYNFRQVCPKQRKVAQLLSLLSIMQGPNIEGDVLLRVLL